MEICRINVVANCLFLKIEIKFNFHFTSHHCIHLRDGDTAVLVNRRSQRKNEKEKEKRKKKVLSPSVFSADLCAKRHISVCETIYLTAEMKSCQTISRVPDAGIRFKVQCDGMHLREGNSTGTPQVPSLPLASRIAQPPPTAGASQYAQKPSAAPGVGIAGSGTACGLCSSRIRRRGVCAEFRKQKKCGSRF